MAKNETQEMLDLVGESEQIMEMANAYPEDTGLPGVMHLWSGKESARVKVFQTDKVIDISDYHTIYKDGGVYVVEQKNCRVTPLSSKNTKKWLSLVDSNWSNIVKFSNADPDIVLKRVSEIITPYNGTSFAGEFVVK